MSELSSLQDDFQRCIMSGDDSVLGVILDSPKERRDVLFGVYRYAYVSRLVDALRNDHVQLHSYVGDEMFNAMGAAYVAANPSQHPNMRWFSERLPDFLRSTEPYSAYPVIGDLAAFERALNDAFDARDGSLIGIEDVAAFPPEIWNRLKFTAHPSAVRIELATNAIDVWAALKDGQEPPDVDNSEEPVRLLIWRQELMPMFRELPAEEAMIWDEASNGITFGVLCSMLATFDAPDTAAARGASYLHGWVTSGLLSQVTSA